MHLLYYHVRVAVTINSTPFYQLDAVEHHRKTVLMVSVENLMSIKFFMGKKFEISGLQYMVILLMLKYLIDDVTLTCAKDSVLMV